MDQRLGFIRGFRRKGFFWNAASREVKGWIGRRAGPPARPRWLAWRFLQPRKGRGLKKSG